MSVLVLGIDIAKQKFDVTLLVDGKSKHKTCKIQQKFLRP